MPHISLPIDVPGIRGPLAFRPDAATHLLGLAETVSETGVLSGVQLAYKSA